MNAVQKSKRTIQTVEIGVGELGFTLIELLISSTLALVLMLTTTTILFQALEFADRQRLRPVLNDKAREIFDLLGDGGCCDTATSPQERLRGMRDRGVFSAGQASKLRGLADEGNNARLQLDHVNDSSSGSFIPIGPETSNVTINCRGEDNPLQGCSSSNSTITVRGFLAQDLRMFKNGEISDAKDRSIDDDERGQENRTIEVEFMLIHPHQANRTRFSSDEIRESYRTIFTFNRSQ